jgi:flagellar hook-associated protein 2
VNKIKSFIQPGGVVASRNEGLKQRIQDVDRQIERTEKNLESTRAMLTQKFANLDAAMARMKGQQQYVGAMAGGGGGGGISLGG